VLVGEPDQLWVERAYAQLAFVAESHEICAVVLLADGRVAMTVYMASLGTRTLTALPLRDARKSAAINAVVQGRAWRSLLICRSG